MPSWSVLTSGWGKRTEGEREKESRQKEGFKIGQKGERKAERGRRGDKGAKASFMHYSGGSQRGKSRGMTRWSRDRARTEEGRVGSNAIMQ